MLVVPVPWAKRAWALPFLTILTPSKASNEASGKRHKTTVDWTWNRYATQPEHHEKCQSRVIKMELDRIGMGKQELPIIV